MKNILFLIFICPSIFADTVCDFAPAEIGNCWTYKCYYAYSSANPPSECNFIRKIQLVNILIKNDTIKYCFIVKDTGTITLQNGTLPIFYTVNYVSFEVNGIIYSNPILPIAYNSNGISASNIFPLFYSSHCVTGTFPHDSNGNAYLGTGFSQYKPNIGLTFIILYWSGMGSSWISQIDFLSLQKKSIESVKYPISRDGSSFLLSNNLAHNYMINLAGQRINTKNKMYSSFKLGIQNHNGKPFVFVH